MWPNGATELELAFMHKPTYKYTHINERNISEGKNIMYIVRKDGKQMRGNYTFPCATWLIARLFYILPISR